ncbi:host attachment family protein [Sphingomonas sp. H39-1-10]|uniref:host attachment family protein n=1 Tax=Sphingomonas pollutisoli TaxID=3030829 RepID=UPI0023B94BAE|nr:host attachment family protein [Sphingomonas pollutisoli]MDF0488967.1 host attachment family protein [Sphingomonas pollutisoli]
MHIPHDAAVLVLDGRKLLWLRNAGSDAEPNLVVEQAREQSDPADHELKTDLAGGAPSGPVIGQATMGEPDYHEQREARFAADAAVLLRDQALANAFESLIIVAPPRTLGSLRPHYHPEVKARLKAEIHKDLTDHPIPDIEAAIRAA